MSGSTPIELDDELWEQLMVATDGAANLCYQCGTCTATCPWYDFTQEGLSVRHYMRRAHLGLSEGGDGLWRCTTCKACESRCPRDVPIVEALKGLRGLDWRKRQVDPILESTLWSVYENYNPYSQPRLERHRWSGDLPVRHLCEGQHTSVLFFVGCESAYDRRLQALPRSISSLLNAAKVDWATLGSREQCCGDIVTNMGDRDYFDHHATAHVKVLEDTKASTIVTASPHCVESLKAYPWEKGPEVVHITDYLYMLLDDKKLEFKGNGVSSATYHDPCYLGRFNGVYEPPRGLLEAAGIKLMEMEHIKRDSLCCGGGGGRIFQDSVPGERFSEPRVQEAAATEAEVMATACPYCIQMFEDSSRTHAPGLVVKDVTELLAQALPKEVR